VIRGNTVAKVYELEGVKPVIDPSSFVHPDAVIIGDVVIGAHCYIGPCASLRGDFGPIRIDDGANIQDHCMLHSFPGGMCHVKKNGHIGHGSILHGCTVEPHGFVGMNSVIMDDAVIGRQAMVAAMAFVKAEFEVPPKALAAGTPAKIVRIMDDEQIAWMSNGSKEYQQLAQRCMAELKPCVPLTELDDNRPSLKIPKTASKALHQTRRKK
jgi:phenylacetic acid degradation protein